MTSAPCNSQFLVSIRSDGIAICPMVVGDDGLYRNLQNIIGCGYTATGTLKNLCTVRLSVRTPPFHGGKTSSILVRCANQMA